MFSGNPFGVSILIKKSFRNHLNCVSDEQEISAVVNTGSDCRTGRQHRNTEQRQFEKNAMIKNLNTKN